MSELYRALVVGSGSIARRHIENLRQLMPNADVGCVSASGRALGMYETNATRRFDSLSTAAASGANLAIIASPAPFHLEHAEILLNAGIPVLIEKPISDELFRAERLTNLLSEHRERIEIAYNMRFLSSARYIKRLLEQLHIGRVHAIQIDVGHYLPDWRPQSDYRSNVSAKKTLGGGVLLELSHELDYLSWLFGSFDRAYCIMSNSGQLEIDVEDKVNILFSREDGLVAQLHMDFLQRRANRQCKIIGEKGSLRWDLNANSVVLESSKGEEVLFSQLNFDRNDMYLEQLRGFIRVAAGEILPRITVDEGLEVLRLIEGIRRSSKSGLPVALSPHSLSAQ